MKQLKALSVLVGAHGWARQAAALLAVVIAAGAFLEPAAQAKELIEATLPRSDSVRPRLRNLLETPRMETVLVWEGCDVDGDGAADFANPTGHAPRVHDAYGSGAFGASRDGGSRHHEGVDYQAQAGQDIAAPISGFVTKIGYAYDNHPDLRFVEITNPATGYAARVFYINPQVTVGQTVRLGETIGAAHTLQDVYPGGMTDHVHLEIAERGRRLDANDLITARYETRALTQG
jgi:murein DD-endopeptidase MepM/ murein hydrolase activator NlpD